MNTIENGNERAMRVCCLFGFVLFEVNLQRALPIHEIS